MEESVSAFSSVSARSFPSSSPSTTPKIKATWVLFDAAWIVACASLVVLVVVVVNLPQKDTPETLARLIVGCLTTLGVCVVYVSRNECSGTPLPAYALALLFGVQLASVTEVGFLVFGEEGKWEVEALACWVVGVVGLGITVVAWFLFSQP